MDIEKIYYKNRLAVVMDLLEISAIELAETSHTDHSLVSKWRRGQRALTRRSKMLEPVAQALLRLDKDGRLRQLTDPYQQQGESDTEAVCAYLTGGDLPALQPRVAPPQRPTSGEYTVQHRVLLGKKGFCSAMLYMLDYVMTLPPNREIELVMNDSFGWLTGNTPFMLSFTEKLRAAFGRGTRLTVITRRGYGLGEDASFAGLWLLAHLKGCIRSLYYDDPPPVGNVCLLASIRDYWSAHAQQDTEVEDALFTAMYTDPLNLRRDEAAVARFHAASAPACQYGFLAHPMGADAEARMWAPGPLPGWNAASPPDGSFYAIQRLPGPAVMTAAELETVLGGAGLPNIPDYLFPAGQAFASGPHKIALCREDVQEALAKNRTQSPQLSQLAGRRVFIPRSMLAAQLQRLVQAMAGREDFEVALVPRTAFNRLQMELVCWRDGPAIGWLQNMQQSVYACSRTTSGAFYGACGFAWQCFMLGWKSKDKVRRQLLRWLDGQDLTLRGKDSAHLRNWRAYPKSWGDDIAGKA